MARLIPWTFFFTLLAAITPCAASAQVHASDRSSTATVMIAAGHPLAVQAGIEMLEKGGNAFDAVTAAAFALSVLEPHASGLGGGGFMVTHSPNSLRTEVMDFRETAPSGLKAEHYTNGSGEITGEKMQTGPLSVGVPGMARALWELQFNNGWLEFSDCLDPAIRLAEDGFEIDKRLHAKMVARADLLAKNPSAAQIFLKDGRHPWDVGTQLIQTDLAMTLKKIKSQGPSAIYGDIAAAKIARSIQDVGGVVSAKDIMRYEPRQTPKIRTSYRGYEIVTTGPPSQGGLIVLETLNQLEKFDLAALGPDSPEFYTLLIGALDNAYKICGEKVADPATYPVPVAWMLSPDWTNAARAEMVMPSTLDANAVKTVPGAINVNFDLPGIEGNTTHLSVADKEGNVVALTQSINGWFGSGIVVPEMGIVLNNHMADFTFEADHPNAPAAGKIPRSSIAPVLVFKDGKPVGTLGSPGGPRIPSAVVQTLIQKIDFGKSMNEAIQAPRVFFNTRTRVLSFESPISDETMQKTAAFFPSDRAISLEKYESRDEFFGGVQGVWIDRLGDALEGGADARRNAAVGAY